MGFVPAVTGILSCGSTRLISSATTVNAGQASAGSASTPEREPARSVQRICQGRLVILLALAFELPLGFPETRDARCDFGAVARESFFLRHRHPLSLFDSRSAIIHARE